MIRRAIGVTVIVLGLAAGLSADQAVCPLPNNTKPKEVNSLQSFKRIAVLEDGRIKPLDSYARNLLLRLSGKSTFDRKPAINWLARLLFAPGATINDKVFLINNSELPMALGIEPEPHRRYSYAELEPGATKLHELALKATAMDKKSRTLVEEEIIRVYSNLRLFSDLSFSFQFAFPHPDFTLKDPEAKKKLNLPAEQGQFSFLEIITRADLLATFAQTLEGKDASDWNPTEKEVLQVLDNLYQWSQNYRDFPLEIIPNLEPDQEEWLSPWDAIAYGFQDESIKREITSLSDLSRAYWGGQQLEFDLAARTFNDSIAQRSSKHAQKNLQHIDLENLYNQLNFFGWAKLLYLFAFTIFLFSLISSASALYGAAWILVLAGFVMHAAALAMRINILMRPPVTNLYETFIFVSFVTVLVGIIMERVNKNWLGIVVCGVCGFVFLTIADKFSAEGDTLRMLVAVLNSNFWLGTHVISITTGYAGVCVAGILGHVYLLQGIFKSKDQELLATTYRNIIGVLGFGFTMTFLGTNLGGIWADQSWGRFWGWDPKENGALLIVLWCAIVFHAKVGRKIGPLGFAIGSILGIVVVMWAWFGVNLLNVGLHSYGFTSGVAGGLILYFVLETLFLMFAIPAFKKRTTLVQKENLS